MTSQEAMRSALVAEASLALRAIQAVSDDLERLLNELPRSTSKKLRESLVDAKVRLDDAALGLGRELDCRTTDPESISLRSRLARRALRLLEVGALVGTLAAGGGQVVAAHAAIRQDIDDVQAHLDAIEECYQQLLVVTAPQVANQGQQPDLSRPDSDARPAAPPRRTRLDDY